MVAGNCRKKFPTICEVLKRVGMPVDNDDDNETRSKTSSSSSGTVAVVLVKVAVSFKRPWVYIDPRVLESS